MATAAEFVRRYPATVYCVDHAGYPVRRDRGYFAEWSAGMRKLAKVENTVVKVSGQGTYDRAWTVESLQECPPEWWDLSLGPELR
jgi:predicted TIM-barrel fold metal-dependent hydrolase